MSDLTLHDLRKTDAMDRESALRAENERLRKLLGDLVALIDWTISPEFQARIDAATKGGKP